MQRQERERACTFRSTLSAHSKREQQRRTQACKKTPKSIVLITQRSKKKKDKQKSERSNVRWSGDRTKEADNALACRAASLFRCTRSVDDACLVDGS